MRSNRKGENKNSNSENAADIINVTNTANVVTDKNSGHESSPITFTLTSLGDSLCHNTQYWDAYSSKRAKC